MKRKYWFAVLLVQIFLLLIGSIPRLYEIRPVDSSEIAEYPVLNDAYSDLREQYSLYEIIPDETICIATIRNLWGCWERYILPCYLADIPNIPGDKLVNCHTALCVLSPWKEESFFTDRCRLRVANYAQRIVPGENTFLYEDAEFTWPQLVPARYRVYAQAFSSDTAFICDELPTTHTDFAFATNDRKLKTSQLVTTTISFDYTLKMLGREICIYYYELPCEHLVNE